MSAFQCPRSQLRRCAENPRYRRNRHRHRHNRHRHFFNE